MACQSIVVLCGSRSVSRFHETGVLTLHGSYPPVLVYLLIFGSSPHDWGWGVRPLPPGVAGGGLPLIEPMVVNLPLPGWCPGTPK